MNKKKVRVFMIHPYVSDVDDLVNFLKIQGYENKNYEFIWDEESCDYLIASEHIYYHRRDWDRFVRLYSQSKINIFFAGECISPDLNVFDYSIAFDNPLYAGDRVCRIPPRIYYNDLIFAKKNDLENDYQACIDELKRKKNFCNFIYSNPNGHDNRELLFRKASEYKKVDSLGRFLNNSTIKDDKYGEGSWSNTIQKSISVKRNYKFSIACENASFSGYTSEKIYSSLEAHTVPIYWGNPLVVEDVNPKAFINCHEYADFDEVIARIKEIDNDDSKWIEIVSQPWLTEEQLVREERALIKYDDFLNNIFECEINEAKRCGDGFHPDWYRKWFFKYQIVRDLT